MLKGKFVISLDFELLWGVRDKRTIESYGANIAAVHELMPTKLGMFKQYGINATFSTVGMLFLNNREALESHIPKILPQYANPNLSPYNGHFASITAPTYKYHFAPELIQLINNTQGQEIGSHTYSHYYCLEAGQTVAAFEADMQMAVQIANAQNLKLESLVFPRNQFNDEYLAVIKNLGFTNYRGNETHWLYEARSRNHETKLRRAIRLIDAYINISGNHIYSIDESLVKNGLVNIPASCFLRPYSNKLSWLEGLRLRRIKNAMTAAAKKGKLFHLWWHPHNFGTNTQKMFGVLEEVLKHYQFLNKQYGFESITMSALAKAILYDR
jgi:peptidoglycan/xylan/chitin deacetylase (PgdA/CDA1 family)